MFGFRRRVIEFLDDIDMNVISLGLRINKLDKGLRVVMGNQEVLDAYAEKIAEQNNQIKSAVAVIISEIGKLQKAADVPLDTTKIDAAIDQLTAAVDEVEAIPASDPVPTAPVDVVEDATFDNANTWPSAAAGE